MKSKYGIYALLFFITCNSQIYAMKEEDIESYKDEWHVACIYWAFTQLLETKTFKKDARIEFVPLPFEIVGSKKFIAKELRKKLDEPELQNNYLKKLAIVRNDIFRKLEENRMDEYSKSCKSSSVVIDGFKLLPFILSLEEPIQERIMSDSQYEMQIEWRKRKYKWINYQNRCLNVHKCLDLDIEKEFTLEELQNDYR